MYCDRNIYILPYNSLHGHEAERSFNHSSFSIARFENKEYLIITHELYIDEKNIILECCYIDDVVNDHVGYVSDFLIDNTLFIFKWIFNNRFNKYTSVSTRGSAVVDYVVMMIYDISNI